MDQNQKNNILKLIQETLGIESLEEITDDAEFIADLNASIEEVKQVISQSEEILEVEIDGVGPINNLTIGKFFEILEESLI